MPPTRVSFPLTTYQYPDGNPVANGTLDVRLSQDGMANDTQVQRNFSRVALDSSGVITGSPTFWHNSDISPSGTYYVFNVYNKQGQLVAGPNKITI
jgi:hypothetical protein